MTLVNVVTTKIKAVQNNSQTVKAKGEEEPHKKSEVQFTHPPTPKLQVEKKFSFACGSIDEKICTTI
ncbi:hypothetical protein T01_12823 [Trichinella spiralis]|uniref:Uncharacterized protein n=1 Tax=Trichinella spiralis TaxID=6334 RepID=A0A0V1AT86_TRISP|nr:hypothetical protein T01_12823 [Trichinella spiralis]